MPELELEGAWVFTPPIHADRRGNFHEWFNHAAFEAAAGRRLEVAQANCSVSVRGAIRGIHVSDVPPGQAKYVICTSGSILDVIVDLRTGSPTFGQWQAVPLNDQNRSAVFIEEGLGHGFAALSDEATVLYLCSTAYAPQRERGIHPCDPALGIAWPAGLPLVLSDKDAAAPSLAQAMTGSLLPDYAACRAARNRP
ncbi:MAG TPA: dTDP-4-dehydrorhamnose 3,5-epimerase [Streptosporangiaceae bacterium]|nr:dTDP-4-dehydrorhamnose 3,5-epimerase [Streptosporangiaceae bacterium]